MNFAWKDKNTYSKFRTCGCGKRRTSAECACEWCNERDSHNQEITRNSGISQWNLTSRTALYGASSTVGNQQRGNIAPCVFRVVANGFSNYASGMCGDCNTINSSFWYLTKEEPWLPDYTSFSHDRFRHVDTDRRDILDNACVWSSPLCNTSIMTKCAATHMSLYIRNTTSEDISIGKGSSTSGILAELYLWSSPYSRDLPAAVFSKEIGTYELNKDGDIINSTVSCDNIGTYLPFFSGHNCFCNVGTIYLESVAQPRANHGFHRHQLYFSGCDNEVIPLEDTTQCKNIFRKPYVNGSYSGIFEPEYITAYITGLSDNSCDECSMLNKSFLLSLDPSGMVDSLTYNNPYTCSYKTDLYRDYSYEDKYQICDSGCDNKLIDYMELTFDSRGYQNYISGVATPANNTIAILKIGKRNPYPFDNTVQILASSNLLDTTTIGFDNSISLPHITNYGNICDTNSTNIELEILDLDELDCASKLDEPDNPCYPDSMPSNFLVTLWHTKNLMCCDTGCAACFCVSSNTSINLDGSYLLSLNSSCGCPKTICQSGSLVDVYQNQVNGYDTFFYSYTGSTGAAGCPTFKLGLIIDKFGTRLSVNGNGCWGNSDTGHAMKKVICCPSGSEYDYLLGVGVSGFIPACFGLCTDTADIIGCYPTSTGCFNNPPTVAGGPTYTALPGSVYHGMCLNRCTDKRDFIFSLEFCDSPLESVVFSGSVQAI